MRIYKDLTNPRLKSEYYSTVFPSISRALVKRIHENPSLNLKAAFLNERKIGFEYKQRKKFSNMPIKYAIKCRYISTDLTDMINYFYQIGDNIRDLQVGDVFKDVDIIYPLRHHDSKAKISSMQVLNVFSSKARPLLLECNIKEGKHETSKKVVFKKGGDLRKDMLVMSVFYLFNYIWETAPLRKDRRPEILRYDVVTLSEKYSFVEFVENVESTTKYNW